MSATGIAVTAFVAGFGCGMVVMARMVRERLRQVLSMREARRARP